MESGNSGFIDSSITITAVATAAVASANTTDKSPLLPIPQKYEPCEKSPLQPRWQDLIYHHWQFLSVDLLSCRLLRQCPVIASRSMWQSARKSRDVPENAKPLLSGQFFSSILTDPRWKTRYNDWATVISILDKIWLVKLRKLRSKRCFKAKPAFLCDYSSFVLHSSLRIEK